MNTQLYNIICLSNQQWDYPLPTNKKHVMSRLAERGHKVLFVDPPINTGRMFVRQVLGGKWGIGRLSTQTYRGGTALIYSPLKPIPSAGVTAGWHISKIQKVLGYTPKVELKDGIRDQVNNLLKNLNVEDTDKLNSASKVACWCEVRITSFGARAPNRSIKASIIIDFPLPVSPVNTVSPEVNSSSSCSIKRKWVIFNRTSIF